MCTSNTFKKIYGNIIFIYTGKTKFIYTLSANRKVASRTIAVTDSVKINISKSDTFEPTVLNKTSFNYSRQRGYLI